MENTKYQIVLTVNYGNNNCSEITLSQPNTLNCESFLQSTEYLCCNSYLTTYGENLKFNTCYHSFFR